MMDLIDIGKRIKGLRKDANLTQSKVADFLSLDQSMIAKIERGERSISSDVIEKLSYLFCCTKNYILTGEDSEQKCMISFRSGDITESDLESLTIINKIVLNQFEMDKIARL
ncbi:MAG: helix-turn-helix transcriptional regulator [Lachnospiraceae bacterium]|jgi:hypothetical protein|nr:helix-turn-helix transcriptional regulator [uncultured Lachnoanaerobaculum sp.]MDU5596622.1 helix-turn-helix transcriptional regulator [Lachnospiraceae bacterium]